MTLVGGFRVAVAALALTAQGVAAAQAPMDPANPTCPRDPDWSDYPEMRFTVRETAGGRVLVAEGPIDATAVDRLDTLLQTFEGREVWLRSRGGSLRAGAAAALLIREWGLITRVPRGWTCASACSFMFLGGRERFVEPGGVFMATTGENRATPPEAVPREKIDDDYLDDVARRAAMTATEQIDFMIRMGVARRFLSEVVFRQQLSPDPPHQSSRHCLSAAELQEYNVTTTRWR